MVNHFKSLARCVSCRFKQTTMKKLILGYATLFFLSAFGQTNEALLKQSTGKTLDDIKSFVAIPNNSLNTEDIKANIQWLTNEFNKRGFNSTILTTEGEPLFFASLPMKDDQPTVLFYMHFDGQPVDPAKWSQVNPYGVVLKVLQGDTWMERPWSDLQQEINPDWRIFGRSVSDDKGPIVMMLHALDMLSAKGQTIPYNVKVILDSEEERGSKPLPKAVAQYKDLLAADLMIITDSPVHPSGQPTLVYGCRGITTVNLTTYGPIKPQHSGHFGNYAPNPGMRLSQLLSSMKDLEGRVLIEGFYDGITLDEGTKTILAAVPDDRAQLLKRLAIHTPEKVGMNYQESLQYPSLNVRGMASGWVGAQARTIVPDKATAAIDIRLVPETNGRQLQQLLKKHIEAQGFFVTSEKPTLAERQAHAKIARLELGSVTDAFRTDMNSSYSQWLQQTLEKTFPEEIVNIRIMGGTVPIAPFINALDVPAVIVPMVNPDNNQHSPNENLSIEQVIYGLRTFEALLSNAMP